jgi:hypothetical protein
MTACRVSLSPERGCYCQRPAAAEAAEGAEASAHAEGTEVPPPSAFAGFTPLSPTPLCRLSSFYRLTMLWPM